MMTNEGEKLVWDSRNKHWGGWLHSKDVSIMLGSKTRKKLQNWPILLVESKCWTQGVYTRVQICYMRKQVVLMWGITFLWNLGGPDYKKYCNQLVWFFEPGSNLEFMKRCFGTYVSWKPTLSHNIFFFNLDLAFLRELWNIFIDLYPYSWNKQYPSNKRNYSTSLWYHSRG